MLNAILNIIWLVVAGIGMAIGWVLAGVILCITIIGIPFGIQAFKIAGYVIWPFGRTVVRRADAGVGSGVGNVLWIVLAGWWLAIGTIVFAVGLCLTIIGIPMGIAAFKLLPIVFMPFGHTIVDSDSPEAASGVAIR